MHAQLRSLCTFLIKIKFTAFLLNKYFGTVHINGFIEKIYFFKWSKWTSAVLKFNIVVGNTRSTKKFNSMKIRTVFRQKGIICVGSTFFRKCNIN